MKELLAGRYRANLLWTGGWDSTFQLLQLLIIQQRRVIPFYVIDAERRSTGVELRTMKRIKDRLFREHPYTRELLLPTRYSAVTDIAPDAEIEDAHKAILEERFIARQYEWLARFCKEQGVADMQLCMQSFRVHHKGDINFDELVSESKDGLYRVNPGYAPVNECKVLGCFSFPVITLTKLQMSDIAKEQGLTEIMGMTWFCRFPRKKMRPCGRCGPCLHAIEEGVGWRIPMRGRAASVFQRSINLPLRSLAKTVTRKLGLLDRIRWRGLQKRAQREARNR